MRLLMLACSFDLVYSTRPEKLQAASKLIEEGSAINDHCDHPVFDKLDPDASMREAQYHFQAACHGLTYSEEACSTVVSELWQGEDMDAKFSSVAGDSFCKMVHLVVGALERSALLEGSEGVAEVESLVSRKSKSSGAAGTRAAVDDIEDGHPQVARRAEASRRRPDRREWRCLSETPGKYGCPVTYPTPQWTIDQIVLNRTELKTDPGLPPIRTKFYRNLAYEAGLTGYYTFLVLENDDLTEEGAEAPLWFYQHGGGAGYFDMDGNYYGSINQNMNTYNHEENYNKMWFHFTPRTTHEDKGFGDGPFAATLLRRLQDGYRVVLTSYSDHDGYTGAGKAYARNPKPGKQINGMQASLSALDFTLQNFPTSYYFMHGTSAGSLGVYFSTMALVYARYEPLPVGTIPDSWEFTVRRMEFFSTVDRLSGGFGAFKQNFSFDSWQMAESLEPFAKTQESKMSPEDIMRSGFAAVPFLFVYGWQDGACGGLSDVIFSAENAGYDNNCKWMHAPMEEAAEGTIHTVLGFEQYGHVPTVKADQLPASDAVDVFVRRVVNHIGR